MTSAPKPPLSVWSRIDWRNALFLTLTPIAALILVPISIYRDGFSWGLFAFFAVSFVISNMSITCGYHRCFSHRSYDAHPIVELLYVLLGSGAFQGSVLEWCTDHRRHHRMVDTNHDPYSIKKGFWYAHIGWLFTKDESRHAGPFAKDLERRKLIAFQHRHYALIATSVGFGLPGALGWAMGFGWGGLIFGGLLRVVCSEHSTFFINSLCHTLGRQPYNDAHTARDSSLMALFTFGEGYHNFHHQFQADYRNGVRWYQWDPTKWWIRSLSLVGLARRLKQASKEEILKARLAMDERLMLARGASADRLAGLKARITDAADRMRRQTRVERSRARTDFRVARRQWRAYARSLRTEAA